MKGRRKWQDLEEYIHTQTFHRPSSLSAITCCSQIAVLKFWSLDLTITLKNYWRVQKAFVYVGYIYQYSCPWVFPGDCFQTPVNPKSRDAQIPDKKTWYNRPFLDLHPKIQLTAKQNPGVRNVRVQNPQTQRVHWIYCKIKLRNYKISFLLISKLLVYF